VSAEGPLVTLIVGDAGRAGSPARSRGRQVGPKAASGPPTETVTGGAGAEGAAPPGARQWSCRWTPEGPGPVSGGPHGEADLTLGLSWADAALVVSGELPPSVAYMQGRLKTSGDNALLLKVLAWSATTAFAAALAQWEAREPG